MTDLKGQETAYRSSFPDKVVNFWQTAGKKELTKY